MTGRTKREESLRREVAALKKQLSATSTLRGAMEIPPNTGIAQRQQVTMAAMASMSWSGPVPPSHEMRAYDELDPGRAGKLLQLAEDQSRHRMALENKVINSDIRRSWAGLFVAGALSFSLLAVGAWLIHTNHDTAGGLVITTTLGGVLVAFIYGRSSQSQERKERAEAVAKKKK